MAKMCYSVGTSVADFKVVSDVTVSGTTATFVNAQTGNIGVGDEITYNTTDKMYITGKVSQSVWAVASATGGTPTSGSDVVTNSIKRAFNDLNSALNGATPGAADANHLNTLNLVTATIQLDIACYDDGNDASLTEITTDWTTDSSYYIKVYTPIDTINDCNQNQRHDGTYDGSGYTLTNALGTTEHTLEVNPSYTKVFGLKIIKNSNNWNFGSGIHHGSVNIALNCEIAYNEIFCDSGLANAGLITWSSGATKGYGVYIHDNIVGSNSNDLLYGIRGVFTFQTVEEKQNKIYNNTVYGIYENGGIDISLSSSASPTTWHPLVVNNYVANTDATAPDYLFSGADYDNSNANFKYNASDDTTAGTSNDNKRVLIANAQFNDTTYATLDLHVDCAGSLVNQGIGKGCDSNVAQYDIDNEDRGNGCSTVIGADYCAAPVTPGAAANGIGSFLRIGL